MSASPMARQLSESKSIPIRKVAVNDPSEIPPDCSSTPGGTMYSTTPGGTKIVYERSFLMNLRSSPISRTPPKCDIPEHIRKDYKYPKKQEPFKGHVAAQKKTPTKGAEDGHQFDMDI